MDLTQKTTCSQLLTFNFTAKNKTCYDLKNQYAYQLLLNTNPLFIGTTSTSTTTTTTDPICPNNLVYSDCGSACITTCNNVNDIVACTLQCVPGCVCPSELPVLHDGRFVTRCNKRCDERFCLLLCLSLNQTFKYFCFS